MKENKTAKPDSRREAPQNTTAYYHLPGLFEFYELYRVFLPLFFEHREYFYDWCEIGSLYGAPADCIWGGGRVGGEGGSPRRWGWRGSMGFQPG